MSQFELFDPDEARAFLLQGLWLQRVLPPTVATVQPALRWAHEVASQGQPLPPIGFVADLGHAASALDWELKTNKPKVVVPNLPSGLMTTYEDHVLGKIYADWTFSRAGEALRRYKEEGRERARGLAYLVNQFRERARFPGVELTPSVVGSLLEKQPEEVLREGFELLQRDGLLPVLQDLYDALIAAARRMAEVLGPEDVFELEHKTALLDLGDRMAQRQVLTVAHGLESRLPRQPVKPLSRRQEVPTKVLEEDTYPIGGFTSISTRGTVESLLHSQLAFIEENGERPDLFEIKFVRDELLYYSRDENNFLRRRRTFVIALDPELIEKIHFKDAELQWQRGILLVGLLVVVVRKLSEWLNTDSLLFEFVFVTPEEKAPAPKKARGKRAKDGDSTEAAPPSSPVIVRVQENIEPPPETHKGPLGAEWALLRAILSDQIANGTVHMFPLPSLDAVAAHCTHRAQRSLCHCLLVSPSQQALEADDTVVTQFQVASGWPALAPSGSAPEAVEADDATESWYAALEQLLRRWV